MVQKRYKMKSLKIFHGLSLTLSLLLSFSTTICAAEDDGDMPQVPAQTQACYDQTMIQWAKDEMAKQPNPKMMAEIEDHIYPFVKDESLEASAEEVKVDNLAKEGLPTADQWKEISNGKDFTHFRAVTLSGQKIVIADNGYVEGHVVDVYLKKKDGYKRLLRLDDEIADIHLMKLGKNSPIFILTHTSGGGSGWGGKFYLLNSDGTLTDELTIGGWQAGTDYADVDKTGSYAVINSNSTGTEVNGDSLTDRLKKCPGYKEFHFVGPQFTYVTVYKWKGNKFENLGEFYSHGEW